MSALLLLMLVACVIGAISLAAYSAFLVRGRKRPNVQTLGPPVATAPPAVAQPRPVALPGMPPKHLPAAPPTWAAVDRKLDEPPRARGSIPPPRRVDSNRFDEVATTGLPVVRRPPEDFSDEDAGEHSYH
jgi:hypothetical protein